MESERRDDCEDARESDSVGDRHGECVGTKAVDTMV
jgi:hypothetical protein